MARSYAVNINVDDPTNAVWFQKTGSSNANTYFPSTLYGEASFDLTVSFWHGFLNPDGTVPSGTTPANFVSGDGLTLYGRIEDQPSGVAELSLATGSFTIGDNEILFEVDAGVIPNEWSRVDLDTTSKYPIAIWFNGTHEADELTAKTNVIVIDKEHVGTGDALILDASNLTYSPATPANWDVIPTLMNEGLDELADRVQTIEDNPASGDMQKAVYDPQVIEADAFDRNNMIGTQLASTISDFETAIANSTSVSGTVTVHADMNSAGSGDVITTQERADLSTASSHVSSTSNPHNVTPLQLGNTTAQWNADKIQDKDLPIPAGATDDQKSLNYDFATDKFILVTPAGAGGGETNDLVLDAGATGETIRVTKTGSDIIIKGVSGANNVTVSTVGSDIVIDVIDSAENVRGAIAIANTATVDAGTDDTQAITTLKMTTKLSDYQLKAPIVKTTSGVYSSTGDDAGKFVKIDNDLTLESLTEGHTCVFYNTTGSAVSLIEGSGVTIDNTSDNQIMAKGTISVFYMDANTVVVDGNTEI